MDKNIIHSGKCGECSWSINNNGELRIFPSNGALGLLDNSKGYVRNGVSGFDWRKYASDIKSVVVEKGVMANQDASYMFANLYNCTSMDLSGLDTSNVTDMGYMFDKCSSLTSLNVSNFDTSSVTDMSYMFYGCSSLTSLDVSNFDTSKVTKMRWIFRDCNSLISLDVSNFDTSKVKDMGYMFDKCSSLTELDLSNWDTSNVTTMYNMFLGCSSLTSLDLSSFNTSKVTDMSFMFYSCSSLTNLDLSNFDVSKVKYTTDMFKDLPEKSQIVISPGQKDLFEKQCSQISKNFVLPNTPQVNKVKVQVKDVQAWAPKVTQQEQVYVKSKGKDNKPDDDFKL